MLKAVFATEVGIPEGLQLRGYACIPLGPSFFALRVELRVDLVGAAGSASGAARFLFRQRRQRGRVSESRRIGQWYMMVPWAAFSRFWGE